MTDNIPNEQPVPAQPDAYASSHPMGTAYDPMPLSVAEGTRKNWMGIVSLITGILALSFFAVLFGILGLAAVRNGEATNRGQNIWGIVLGVFWFVVGFISLLVLRQQLEDLFN